VGRGCVAPPDNAEGRLEEREGGGRRGVGDGPLRRAEIYRVLRCSRHVGWRPTLT
jgi:hypothetical protein